MNYYIVIGNGFSIDYLKFMNVYEGIDLGNLFKFGDSLIHPVDNKPGFLSQRHCPNMWQLGIRPNCTTEECINYLESIILCNQMKTIIDELNFDSLKGRRRVFREAYIELVLYLKQLFVYYDKMIQAKINDSDKDIASWHWSEFFKKINEDDKVTKYISLLIIMMCG